MLPLLRRKLTPRRRLMGNWGGRAGRIACSASLLLVSDNVSSGVGIPSWTRAGIENDFAFYDGNGFVIALAGIWLKARLVIEVAPGVEAANLIRPAGNAHHVTALGEVKTMACLLFEGLAEWIGCLNPWILTAIEVLRIIDELDDLISLLCLQEDATVRHLHRVEGQIGDAGPGDHQIARLFDPHDLFILKHCEQVAKVVVRRKGFVGRRPPLLFPVLVVCLGVASRPGERIARGLLDPRSVALDLFALSFRTLSKRAPGLLCL